MKKKSEKSSVMFLRDFCLCAAFFLTVFLPLHASANLMIVPLRVTFTGRDRTADITLLNTSNETNVYRMGWVYNRMEEDGSYTKQADPLTPGYDPAGMILFSPRQVRIPPGGRQKIRMTLRRPPNIPDGEYMAHLRLQKLAESDGADDAYNGRGMSLQILTNLGFALPVVIRQGTYNSSVSIESPRFISPTQSRTGKPQMAFELHREGLHSAVGRILILWRRPDGTEQEVGKLNNVAIYTTINKRFINVNLKEYNIQGGQIRILYEGTGPDKGIIFDEKVFPVGR